MDDGGSKTENPKGLQSWPVPVPEEIQPPGMCPPSALMEVQV